jgi:hypothetical protein
VFTITLVKPEHPANAFAPTLVTDDGMVIVVKPVQLWNANSPMVRTDDGMVIVVRLEQPVKALAAILVMVEPNVTLAKLERAHTGTSPA